MLVDTYRNALGNPAALQNAAAARRLPRLKTKKRERSQRRNRAGYQNHDIAYLISVPAPRTVLGDVSRIPWKPRGRRDSAPRSRRRIQGKIWAYGAIKYRKSPTRLLTDFPPWGKFGVVLTKLPRVSERLTFCRRWGNYGFGEKSDRISLQT